MKSKEAEETAYTEVLCTEAKVAIPENEGRVGDTRWHWRGRSLALGHPLNILDFITWAQRRPRRAVSHAERGLDHSAATAGWEQVWRCGDHQKAGEGTHVAWPWWWLWRSGEIDMSVDQINKGWIRFLLRNKNKIITHPVWQECGAVVEGITEEPLQ